MMCVFRGVVVTLVATVSAAAPSSAVEFTTCSGSADPIITEPTCFQGKAGALGVDETVDLKIESFASGKGTLDLTGSGITSLTCSQHAFTKSGQAITTDLSDCLPSKVTVESVTYCSDQDTIEVKVKDTKVLFPITATLSKITCPSLQVHSSSCSGSADPVITEPACYEGKAGALGVDETVDLKIESFASGKGTLDLTGSGITTLACSQHAFTKSGKAITTDLSDCLPSKVTVESVTYCSDQDTIEVTVKDTKVLFPITATLSKITCPSLQVHSSSCSGSADPVITEPTCYEGKAGALGVDETVDLKIESFASGKGTLDLTGSGITSLACSQHAFTKSGKAITTDLSDCLPSKVTVESVEYCSDQDTIEVKVKDTKVLFPITATLTKITCQSDATVVIV